MAVERTLSIIKPDAVAKNVIGAIYSRFETAGLKIIAARMAWLSRPDAEGFYAVHRERPFFKDLVEFMISGPVMIQVLEGPDAIAKNRELMGATDPKKAAPGTIRADFALDRRGRPQQIDHPGYGPADAFYRATGKANAVRTCNAVAADWLRLAGLKTSLWPPFVNGLVWRYRRMRE